MITKAIKKKQELEQHFVNTREFFKKQFDLDVNYTKIENLKEEKDDLYRFDLIIFVDSLDFLKDESIIICEKEIENMLSNREGVKDCRIIYSHESTSTTNYCFYKFCIVLSYKSKIKRYQENIFGKYRFIFSK